MPAENGRKRTLYNVSFNFAYIHFTLWQLMSAPTTTERSLRHDKLQSLLLKIEDFRDQLYRCTWVICQCIDSKVFRLLVDWPHSSPKQAAWICRRKEMPLSVAADNATRTHKLEYYRVEQERHTRVGDARAACRSIWISATNEQHLCKLI